MEKTNKISAFGLKHFRKILYSMLNWRLTPFINRCYGNSQISFLSNIKSGQWAGRNIKNAVDSYKINVMNKPYQINTRKNGRVYFCLLLNIVMVFLLISSCGKKDTKSDNKIAVNTTNPKKPIKTEKPVTTSKPSTKPSNDEKIDKLAETKKTREQPTAEKNFNWYAIEANSAGEKVKCVDYTPEGKIKFSYIFDKNNVVIESTSYYPNEKTALTIQFDNKGNKIKESYFNDKGELMYYYLYEYDQDNNVIKCTKYNQQNKILGYDQYTYLNGLMLKHQSYNANNKPRYVYEVKSQADIIQQYFSPDGSIKYSYAYNLETQSAFLMNYNSYGRMYDSYSVNRNSITYITYDGEGRKIQATDYDASGNVSNKSFFNLFGNIVNTVEYNLQGQITKIMDFNQYGKLTGFVKYIYDSYGKIISVNTYDANGRLKEFVD